MPMAAQTKPWTSDDLDLLPDDGNKYEVVDGQLLVSPAPSLAHEAVLLELAERVRAYCRANRLGQAFPRNDLRFDDANRVDPDLSVVPVFPPIPESLTWATAPRPLLVVEVLSRSTRTHDLRWKRELYRREGIPLTWMVDSRARVVHVIRPGSVDVAERGRLVWHPAGAGEPLVIELPGFFEAVLGREGG